MADNIFTPSSANEISNPSSIDLLYHIKFLSSLQEIFVKKTQSNRSFFCCVRQKNYSGEV